MNDKSHYTMKSSDVYRFTVAFLRKLPFSPQQSRQKVTNILNVLVLAAAFRSSISQVCKRLQGVPSHVTVLKELALAFDDIELLEGKLNALLCEHLPKGLRKKRYIVAIDLVDRPYHGTVERKHAREVRRSRRKSGTTHFFSYATVCLIYKGRRYTLGIYRVRAKEKMKDVVRMLLRRIEGMGIRIGLLLLDRGFYSAEVIRYLIRRDQAFIMPAIRRGRKPGPGREATGLWLIAQAKKSHWCRYTIQSPTTGKITFDLAVVCINGGGRCNERGRQALLFATYNVRSRSLEWIRKTYRKRFGIESSYRQINQTKIHTTTRNPILRLLFVGIALILRNIWVWLHAEVIALPRKGGRLQMLPMLRFQQFLLWLLDEVVHRYRLRREIPISRDFWETAGRFGVAFKY